MDNFLLTWNTVFVNPVFGYIAGTLIVVVCCGVSNNELVELLVPDSGSDWLGVVVAEAFCYKNSEIQKSVFKSWYQPKNM